MSKRTTNTVNYLEVSDHEDEPSVLEIVNMVVDKAVEREKGSVGELNLKKQYRRAIEAAEERGDWIILEEKNLPKGAAVKDSYYFYLDLHPGVFKLASEELSKFLCSDQKIKLRAGRPNRYGDATTTSTCYYTFKIGGKDKTLQLRFYPTKNAFDISMTGANDNKAEKHVEFGMKNGALYFVDEVMPRFIEYLYLNFEVEKTKTFWGNLARTGYEQELKKDGAKGKVNGKGKGKGCMVMFWI